MPTLTVDPSQVSAITVDPSQVTPGPRPTVFGMQPNAATDFLAGAGGSLAQHAVNAYDLLRKIPGAERILPDSASFHKAIADATPESTPAHVGKFLENVAEFAVPGGKASELTKGASLLPRAAAQAAVGAGVSGVQTGGDTGAMATGAVAGAGGEVLGDVVKGAAGAFLAGKSPTLQNFADSFGNATPTQKARISSALDTLKADGVKPADSLAEMHESIKGKLADLGKEYQSLDPAIKARPVPPADVVQHLQDLQKQYTRRGIVTDPEAYRTIDREIQKVQDIATQNGGAPAPKPSGLVNPSGSLIPSTGQAQPGALTVDDLVHLKVGANGKTNFTSPDADKSLWRGIGDAYRSAADAVAPETTALNRSYQKYKDLEQIADQNVARGKGDTQSGLSALLQKGTQTAVGTGAGAAVGHATGIPGAAELGGIIGATIGPKISKATIQALRNAADSGAFKALSPAKQLAIKTMAAIGDNPGILKTLGVAATETAATR